MGYNVPSMCVGTAKERRCPFLKFTTVVKADGPPSRWETSSEEFQPCLGDECMAWVMTDDLDGLGFCSRIFEMVVREL